MFFGHAARRNFVLRIFPGDRRARNDGATRIAPDHEGFANSLIQRCAARRFRLITVAVRSRVCRKISIYHLFLLVLVLTSGALSCNSSDEPKLPDYYGVFASDNSSLTEMKPALRTNKQLPVFEYLVDVNEPLRPEDIIEVRPGVSFIVFNREVQQKLPPVRIYVNNVYELPSEKFRAADEFKTKPVPGRPEMVMFSPSQPLQPGFYEVNIGSDEYAIGVRMPGGADVAEKLTRKRIKDNLGRLHTCCYIWAHDKGGDFPPSLKTLVTDLMAIPPDFVAPLDRNPPPQGSYLYVPGQSLKSNPNNILIYERAEIHEKKGANVVQVDKSVKWLDAAELDAALKQTASNLKP